MTTSHAPARKGEWLDSWDPENEQTWDSSLAWRTLWITTFCLTLAFVAWFLPSAIIPKLNALGYDFTKNQLYWMAAMPGLAAGLLRLVWMTLPPILGTRKMVSLTTLLLIASTLGWGVRVQSPTAPYWELMVLAFLAGIGGVLVVIALWFGAAEPGRDYAVSICALAGALFIGIARFAPDRWIRRCEALFTSGS